MTDRQRTPPGGDDTSQAPGPTRRPWLLWLAIVALLLLPPMFSSTFGAPRMPYSTFVQKLDSGLVASVQVGDSYITGTLKTPDASGEKRFVTNRVDPGIADQLRQHGVPFSGIASGGVLDNLVLWLIPAVLFVAMWWFPARRTLGQQPTGLLGVGKSRARYVETDTKVCFDDVAGVDEAKNELREVVAFLKPHRLRSARRAHPQGHPAGRSAGHRQDAAGPRRGRRSRRALLLDQRLGVRRDVRRRRRGARARPVRAGAHARALHHLRRRARRAGPRARRRARYGRPRREGADAEPAAGRARRLRSRQRGSCCSPPPTGRRSSTRRCCARGASTARSWSTGPIAPAAPRSSPSTCRRSAAAGRRRGDDRGAHSGLHRGRPREPGQRGGAGSPRVAAPKRCRWPTSPPPSSGSWRAWSGETGC